jgi:hypothetical protein
MEIRCGIPEIWHEFATKCWRLIRPSRLNLDHQQWPSADTARKIVARGECSEDQARAA